MEASQVELPSNATIQVLENSLLTDILWPHVSGGNTEPTQPNRVKLTYRTKMPGVTSHGPSSSPTSRTQQRTRRQRSTRHWPPKPACWPSVQNANRTSTASSQPSHQLSSRSLGANPLDVPAVTARFSPSHSSNRPSRSLPRLQDHTTWARTRRLPVGRGSLCHAVFFGCAVGGTPEPRSLSWPYKPNFAGRNVQGPAPHPRLHVWTPGGPSYRTMKGNGASHVPLDFFQGTVPVWLLAQPLGNPRHVDECSSYDSCAAQDMRVTAVSSCPTGSRPQHAELTPRRLADDTRMPVLRRRDARAGFHAEDPHRLLGHQRQPRG